MSKARITISEPQDMFDEAAVRLIGFADQLGAVEAKMKIEEAVALLKKAFERAR